jgi:hypothetical protein
MLVLASYGDRKPLVWEWECFKCHKVVKKEYLKEEELSRDEQFFSKKSREIQEKHDRQRRRDHRKALRDHIHNKPHQ